MTEINKLLDIKAAKTSPYHPQTNGLTERFNKTLCTMLRMYASKHQRDWDEPIPYVAFAYNTFVHSSTNQCPFVVVQGRYPRLISQINFSKEVEDLLVQ